MDSLTSLLAPASIAIVGASPRVESLSGRPLANLKTQGYRGAIYPVNPRYEEIQGLRCYPDLRALPKAPDVVLVLVGIDHVFPTLDQAAEVGARAAIVFAGGFAEQDQEGARKQQALKTYAAKGLRIVGPNCNGIFNVRAGIAMGFSPAFEFPARRGSVGLVCQSGAVATGLSSRGMEKGIGFSKVIATGNEADLEVSDFIEYMAGDPDTSVIALFMEGVKDTPRFLRACTLALERGKPVVAMKVGRTEAGKRVALSHTGAMAGSYEVLAGAMRQRGVVLADDLDEILELASVFARGPKPRHGGVAVASISGGIATFIADECVGAGVTLPSFAQATQQRLSACLSRFANIANPLDVTGQVVNEPASWAECLAALSADAGVDAVVSVMCILANRADQQLAKPIATLAQDGGKLQLCVWMSGAPQDSGYQMLRDGGVPVFFSAAAAVKALAAWNWYWLTRDRRIEGLASATAASPADMAAPAPEDEWKLLAQAGISVPRQALARTRAELGSALSGFQFPIALKVQSASVLHKTEKGALRLGIRTIDEAASAFDGLAAKHGIDDATPAGEGILAQEMVTGRRELILGARVEPGAGVAIALGIGGIFSEVFRDVSLRLAPLSAFDTEEMMAELRGHNLFGAVRGLKPVAPGLVRDALLGLSELALRHADTIREIDINPLIVADDGASCTAVDLLFVRAEQS